jgi:hypothetical protein
MSNLDKNIVITPNVGASDDPKIVFSAANTTANAQNITMRAYPTSNGTLSFEGSAGQLFSITNQLTGTLFSVNDISGIPSIEVLDTGRVNLAPYNGNVVIGGVNSIQLAGNTTGNTPTISTVGTDTNISLNVFTKGTGSILFGTQNGQTGTGGSNTQFAITNTSNAVNYIQATGAATGSGPSLTAQGTDGNASLLINSKGNSDLFLRAGTAGWVSLEPGGNRAFAARHITSQVNYLTVWGSATAGNNTILSAEYSSSANVAINLVPKGNAAVMITGNTTGIITAANSIYVGDRVGYANANNISVVYQSYNSSTNSLDVVFG